MSVEAMKQMVEAIDADLKLFNIPATAKMLEALNAGRQAIQEEALRNVQRLGQEIEAEAEKQEPVALPPVQFEKVADGIEIGYDILGGVDIRLGGEFVYVHINYDYRYTHNSARKWLAEQIVGLLTHPPKREWFGLTDEDFDFLVPYCGNEFDLKDYKDFAQAIEAKLKQKNA